MKTMRRELKNKESEKMHWLKSKEVEKELKIYSCHLMHLRVAGKLKFKKEGNAFLYAKKSVDSEKK